MCTLEHNKKVKKQKKTKPKANVEGCLEFDV